MSLLVLPALILSQSFLPIAALAVGTDSASPITSVTFPTNGSTVSGSVNVSADATDAYSNLVITVFGKKYDVSSLQSTHPGGPIFVNGTDMTSVFQSQHGMSVARLSPYLIPSSYIGVSKVEFYIDGILQFTDTSSPYGFVLNTTLLVNGAHTLRTKTFDQAGNSGSSTLVNFTVNNTTTTPTDTTPPQVSVLSPSNSSSVSNSLAITVSTSDNISGVVKTELYVDGNLTSSATVLPFGFNLDTTLLANGSHTLQVKAYDAAGNVGVSTIVNIVVNNVVVQPGENEEEQEDVEEELDDRDEAQEHEDIVFDQEEHENERKDHAYKNFNHSSVSWSLDENRFDHYEQD